MQMAKAPKRSSASVALADYAQVDPLNLWYESVNFGAETGPTQTTTIPADSFLEADGVVASTREYPPTAVEPIRKCKTVKARLWPWF